MQLKYLIPGSRGEDVKALQAALNQNGESLKVDGIFGMRTLDSVKRVQQKMKETISGKVTPAFQLKLKVKLPYVEPTPPPVVPVSKLQARVESGQHKSKKEDAA